MPYAIRDAICPACGQESLAYDEMSTNQIYCADITCPRMMAAQEILEERETKHILTLTEKTWDLKHPLIERLDGDLFGCLVGRFVGEFGDQLVAGVTFGEWPLHQPIRTWFAGSGEDTHLTWEPLDA